MKITENLAQAWHLTKGSKTPFGATSLAWIGISRAILLIRVVCQLFITTNDRFSPHHIIIAHLGDPAYHVTIVCGNQYGRHKTCTRRTCDTTHGISIF